MSGATPRRPIDDLLAIMRRLRDPEQGCAWDRAQDFDTIAPYTIEEAYEVADAIGTGDPARIRAELGDLLFQVVFHSQLASERGWFGFDEVAGGISAKLTRRHPHVFDDAHYATVEAQSAAWEAFKAEERAAMGQGSVLADIPLALPALLRAQKLGKRAGQAGFDWSSAHGVREKVAEELAEVDHALAAREKSDRVSEELGDLLFAVVNWARHLGLDAEGSLREANAKFERRFAAMERLAAARGLDIGALDAEGWERLWAEAKGTRFSAGSVGPA